MTSDVMMKQLRVKCDVVHRLRKDISLYHVEAQQQRTHIERMVADRADAYDVRKQQEVLDETLNMLPDCETRLGAAFDDLRAHRDAVQQLSVAGATTIDESIQQIIQRADETLRLNE
jgi:tubulin-specific chaperone A